MRSEGIARVLAVALVAGGVPACAGSVAGERAEKAGATIGDAEIAAIVVAANGIDVRYGEIARERAADARVKQFAETMIADHTAVNRLAGELVGRLGVMPMENEVSRSLEAAAAETRQALGSKSGPEFDRAYIDNEVAFHRTVLSTLDDLLIPSARHAELRRTLVEVRPAIEAHLRHAESLRSSLGGS